MTSMPVLHLATPAAIPCSLALAALVNAGLAATVLPTNTAAATGTDEPVARWFGRKEVKPEAGAANLRAVKSEPVGATGSSCMARADSPAVKNVSRRHDNDGSSRCTPTGIPTKRCKPEKVDSKPSPAKRARAADAKGEGGRSRPSRSRVTFAADERVRAVYDGIEYNATVLHQIGINSFQLRFESDEGPWDRATSRARMRKAD